MEFQEITNDIDFLCTSTDESYPIADKTRVINEGMSRVAHIIFKNDRKFLWDDSNYTDEPVYTTDIVAGQSKYDIDSVFHTINRVEVKDSSGTWNKVVPFDQTDIPGAVEEYYTEGDSVYKYDKTNDTFRLFPEPNYSSTGGLKVYVSRTPTQFTTTDTTKTPGFHAMYHRFLSYFASLDYAMKYRQERVVYLRDKLALIEKELASYYNTRDGDRKPTKVRAIRPSAE